MAPGTPLYSMFVLWFCYLYCILYCTCYFTILLYLYRNTLFVLYSNHSVLVRGVFSTCHLAVGVPLSNHSIILRYACCYAIAHSISPPFRQWPGRFLLGSLPHSNLPQAHQEPGSHFSYEKPLVEVNQAILAWSLYIKEILILITVLYFYLVDRIDLLVIYDWLFVLICLFDLSAVLTNWWFWLIGDFDWSPEWSAVQIKGGSDWRDVLTEGMFWLVDCSDRLAVLIDLPFWLIGCSDWSAVLTEAVLSDRLFRLVSCPVFAATVRLLWLWLVYSSYWWQNSFCSPIILHFVLLYYKLFSF